MDKKTIDKIATQVSTPSYVFDMSMIKERVKLIKKYTSPYAKLCFAMKANPFLTGYISPMVDKLEVCSPGEYEICIRNHIPPEKIVVSGVNKTYETMDRIISFSKGQGIYTIESPLHFEILDATAKKYNCRLSVDIRLSSGNQFGVDAIVWKEIAKKVIDSENMDLCGLHYYSGTQKKITKVEKELGILSEFAASIKEEYGINNLVLEYGPGLSVSYFQGEEEIEAEPQLEALGKLLSILNGFSDVVLEMGRFLTSMCGYYFTRVMDAKTNKKENFIIVDGGIHQINYFGQMMGMKHPYVSVVNKEFTEANSDNYTLCGSLCTSNDVITRQIHLPKLEINDILVFARCGAYSMTEGLSLFLSRELPQICIFNDDNLIVTRQKLRTDEFNN